MFRRILTKAFWLGEKSPMIDDKKILDRALAEQGIAPLDIEDLEKRKYSVFEPDLMATYEQYLRTRLALDNQNAALQALAARQAEEERRERMFEEFVRRSQILENLRTPGRMSGGYGRMSGYYTTRYGFNS